MSQLKIRERHRRGYVREACGYIGWYEWQLVNGRKVIGRYDTEALAAAAKKEFEHTASDDDR